MVSASPNDRIRRRLRARLAVRLAAQTVAVEVVFRTVHVRWVPNPDAIDDPFAQAGLVEFMLHPLTSE